MENEELIDNNKQGYIQILDIMLAQFGYVLLLVTSLSLSNSNGVAAGSQSEPSVQSQAGLRSILSTISTISTISTTSTTVTMSVPWETINEKLPFQRNKVNFY